MTPEDTQTAIDRVSGRSQRLGSLLSAESGDLVAAVEPDELLETAGELASAGFDRLEMVTAVDREDFFEMVYRVYSRSLSLGLMVKTRVDRVASVIDSVCSVWPGALWQEREVFDLFGVVFRDHPDLRRILLPDDFVGHPLRRDYDDPRVIRRPDYI